MGNVSVPRNTLSAGNLSSQSSLKQLRFVPIVFLFTALLAQCLFFAWDTGQTVDETYYNGSGYGMVRYNNYRWPGEHPPLMMQIGSLPLLILQPNFPIDSPIPFADGVDIARTGSKFLYQMNNNPRLLLFLERLGIILVTLVLALFVFLWSAQLFGYSGGLISLSFMAFCPNIIAHGSLFTTDLGVSAFFFISIYFLRRYILSPSLKQAAGIGILCGLTILSKISGIFLIPVILLFFMALIFKIVPIRDVKMFLDPKWDQILIILGLVLFIASLGHKLAFIGIAPITYYLIGKDAYFQKFSKHKCFAYITKTVLWAGWVSCAMVAFLVSKKGGYLFAGAGLTWSALWLFLYFRSHDTLYFTKSFALLMLVTFMTILLIYTDFPWTLLRLRSFDHFMQSFNGSLAHAQYHHEACVDGSFITCDWRFFFGIMLIKTPLVVMILSTTAFIYFMIYPRLAVIEKCLVILPPFLFFIAAVFLSKIHIGIRHILPIYPFLFLLLGMHGRWLDQISSTGLKYFAGVVMTVLFSWHSSQSLRQFPHYISYFNELIRSADHGAQLTADSNILWGQDNRRLAEYLSQRGNPPVKTGLHMTNPDEFAYYRLRTIEMTEKDYVTPTPGLYAIDIVIFHSRRKKEDFWFANKQPIARAGRTILLFEVV